MHDCRRLHIRLCAVKPAISANKICSPCRSARQPSSTADIGRARKTHRRASPLAWRRLEKRNGAIVMDEPKVRRETRREAQIRRQARAERVEAARLRRSEQMIRLFAIVKAAEAFEVDPMLVLLNARLIATGRKD